MLVRLCPQPEGCRSEVALPTAGTGAQPLPSGMGVWLRPQQSPQEPKGLQDLLTPPCLSPALPQGLRTPALRLDPSTLVLARLTPPASQKPSLPLLPTRKASTSGQLA